MFSCIIYMKSILKIYNLKIYSNLLYIIVFTVISYMLTGISIASERKLFWIGHYPFIMNSKFVMGSGRDYISFQTDKKVIGNIFRTNPEMRTSVPTPQNSAINFIKARFGIDIKYMNISDVINKIHHPYDQIEIPNQCTIIEVNVNKLDDKFLYNRIFLLYEENKLSSHFICSRKKNSSDKNYTCSNGGYWPMKGDFSLSIFANGVSSPERFVPIMRGVASFFQESNLSALVLEKSGASVGSSLLSGDTCSFLEGQQ